jgi:acyl-coenzyme A thioesterase PaaI-like protein
VPAPDLAQHVTADRQRLARSTRALIEAVAAVGADRDDAAVAEAVDAIEIATRALAGAGPSDPVPRFGRAYADYLPSSLLVGRAHPLSPEGTYTFADGVLEVTVTFGPAYEGPPGYVHGGVVALAFDELFGMCNVCNGQGGLTGRLSVRYRKPTPLGRALRMTAWQEHHEGRRMRVRGRIHADDVLTAEAEGLFVRPRPDTSREYFGEQATRGEV